MGDLLLENNQTEWTEILFKRFEASLGAWHEVIEDVLVRQNCIDRNCQYNGTL